MLSRIMGLFRDVLFFLFLGQPYLVKHSFLLLPFLISLEGCSEKGV